MGGSSQAVNLCSHHASHQIRNGQMAGRDCSQFLSILLQPAENRLVLLSYCDIELFLSMMTSSNGNLSTLLAICERNPPVTGGFPTQRPVMRSFDVFSDLRLNKRLSKQSICRWFETPLRSLWRHCSGIFELWREVSYYVSGTVCE